MKYYCITCDKGNLSGSDIDFDNVLIMRTFNMPILGEEYIPVQKDQYIYYRHKKCNTIVFEDKE